MKTTKQKPRVFYSLQDLDSITSEMAGKEEFSFASGKEEADNLYKVYNNALQQLDTIQANVDNKNTILADKTEYFITIKPTGEKFQWVDNRGNIISKANYDKLKFYIEDLKTEISRLTASLTSKKSEVASYKKQYDAAKKAYDDAVANENRLAAEKLAAEANLQLEKDAAAAKLALEKQAAEAEAETNAKTLELQIKQAEEQIRLQKLADGVEEPETETTVTEPVVVEKKNFLATITKKQWIIGATIFVLIVGSVYAYKKGWIGKKASK